MNSIYRCPRCMKFFESHWECQFDLFSGELLCLKCSNQQVKERDSDEEK